MVYIKTSPELYHHGIQGQKWGVRNGPPYPLKAGAHSAAEKKAGLKKYGGMKKALDSGRNAAIAEQGGSEKKGLTPQQKKAIIAAAVGVAAAAGIGAGVYVAYRNHGVEALDQTFKALRPEDEGKKETYEAMKDVLKKSFGETGAVLKEGDVVHRMTPFADFSLDKTGDALFVAGAEKDRLAYLTMLPDREGTGKKYDVALEVMKEINIPGRDKATKIFNELYSEDPEFKNEIKESLMELLDKGNPKAPKLAKRAYVNQILDDNPLYAATTALAQPGKATSKVADKFKKAGYNAIADYHDIDDHFTDTPLIMFDPKGTLQMIGKQEVSKAFKLDALDQYMKADPNNMFNKIGNDMGVNPAYLKQLVKNNRI